MNERAAMSHYLRPSSKERFLFLLFTVLFLLCVAGAVFASRQPEPEAVRMKKDSASGQYAYIDVQFMSTWILKITGRDNYVYYEAVDADGNPFIVSLSDKQYQEYDEIVQYTIKLINGEISADAAAPPPLRLYGMVSTLPAADGRSMAESYQETMDEYYDVFGKIYLNAKSGPVSDLFSLFIVLAIFLGSFAVITGADIAAKNAGFNRALKRLEETGELENAEREFLRPDNLVFEKQGVVLSENFMYSRPSRIAVHYRDIVWLYSSATRVYSIPIGTMLIVGMRNGRIFAPTSRRVTAEFLNRIAEVVAAKNNDVLLGQSIENQREFRARVKAAKKAAH